MKQTFFVLLMLLVTVAMAQPTSDNLGKRVAVIMSNGNEYIGIITKDDGREIILNSESVGPIYLIKADIKSIRKIDSPKSVVQGEFRDIGPFTTRYCFTTNALGINKGENYTMLNLYGPEVHFALTDRFSTGIMTTWFGSPLVLATKFSIPTKNEKVNFSIGNLLATSGYIQSFRGYGDLLFGNVTFGNRLSNVTLGAGFFYFQGGSKEALNREMAPIQTSDYGFYNTSNYEGAPEPITGPMFSLGAISRVGAKASFVFDSMIGFFTHNYYERNTTTLREPVYNNFTGFYESGLYEHQIVKNTSKSAAFFLMPGMRFQKDERRAFQVSLAGVVLSDGGETFSFPIPFCTWFYRF
jgi:hypothetical protein